MRLLAEAGNNNWTQNTWRKHRTAEAHILRYEREVGKRLNYPFSMTDTLNYLGFVLARYPS